MRVANRRRGSLFWGLVAATILLVLVSATTLYLQPLWVFNKIQRIRLKVEGVTDHEVLIGGHRIHYYVRGPVWGPPVVLVHGLGGRAEDWGNLLPYLIRAGYRVYTPDLLGFGQSEEPPNASYSIAEQARVVVRFIDAMGLKQTDLVGWSMGGWIAQKVAVDHPERVRRLVLMDSAGLSMPPSWDTRLFTPNSREDLEQLDALLMPHPPRIPEFLVADILRVSHKHRWVIERAMASMLTAKDVMDAQLPSLQMPVLILWGDQDQITPLSEGRAIHALISHSRLSVARDCGHLAPEECADRFGPEMAAFLQATTELSPGESVMSGQ
ncbi:alpha/beta fold hydrolase [Acidicapsa ligni]|uniref:alpha/beta fold hydrolase n=1 Tax=Acidicapsa ligni TaxID=542300 RepID=UPI0021E0C968|nr:alpha/beta hydrolase [Acidicapsa ligni]